MIGGKVGGWVYKGLVYILSLTLVYILSLTLVFLFSFRFIHASFVSLCPL